MTEYVILCRNKADDWVEQGRYTARSAEAAMRDWVGTESVTLVAIPARSWRPMTVTVESVAKVSLALERARAAKGAA